MMQKIKTNLLKNNWSESYLLNHNNPSEKTTLMNACFARPSKIFITEDRVYIQLQSTEKPGDIEVSMDVNVYQTSPSEIKYDLFDHLATRWKEVR